MTNNGPAERLANEASKNKEIAFYWEEKFLNLILNNRDYVNRVDIVGVYSFQDARCQKVYGLLASGLSDAEILKELSHEELGWFVKPFLNSIEYIDVNKALFNILRHMEEYSQQKDTEGSCDAGIKMIEDEKPAVHEEAKKCDGAIAQKQKSQARASGQEETGSIKEAPKAPAEDAATTVSKPSTMLQIDARSDDLETSRKTIQQKDTEGSCDLGDLQKYCAAGIKMIGVYSNGAQIANGADIENAFTSDPKIIRNLLLGKDPRTKGQKINRFYFRPSYSGLLCIDIDIKNGKDGLKEFYAFCKTNAEKDERQLQKELQDLPNNFPVYVATANGGYHLYFKHTWTEKQQKAKNLISLCTGVEVPYNIIPAGSFKDGKPYALHGDISEAPPLPEFIEIAIFNTEIIKKKTNEVSAFIHTKKTGTYKAKSKKVWGKPSWKLINDWTEKYYSSKIAAGRNCRATSLAICAKTHGYASEETLTELLRDTAVNSLEEKEIETVVKSIYKRK
jgi:hypothetical protein